MRFTVDIQYISNKNDDIVCISYIAYIMNCLQKVSEYLG